ncbi:hypothetical protein [Rummeliibacillus suwonensis]|uniref:hypothetical protein n=1 Tax=Rummeliibacillus suwonensis TaxID=1306154 RepID=UPI00289BC593|nr:hypothetical protein [Rummeliibacillus suwonensis]
MKKLLNILSISILITVLCSTTTSNAKTTNDDIDLLLIPYNKVMTKLSAEYGVNIYVPEKNKEKFFKSVQDMSPKAFEKLLRDQYKESEKYMKEFSYDQGEYKNPYPSYIPNAENTIPASPMNP